MIPLGARLGFDPAHMPPQTSGAFGVKREPAKRALWGLYGGTQRESLPWSTNESLLAEQRRLDAWKTTDRNPYPPLDIVNVNNGDGWRAHGDRWLPRWLARIVKRNAFYFGMWVQFGFHLSYVNRYRMAYAPSFVHDIARLTGMHPITVAENARKRGVKLTAAPPGRNASDR